MKKRQRWWSLTTLIASLCIMFALPACSHNKSNGDRVGLVTKFSREGVFIKTWEGELNMTQTGMNSNASESFKFSINKREELRPEIQRAICTLDSAMQCGWKVKLRYRQCSGGLNLFNRQGSTNYFIQTVSVLDRDPLSVFRWPGDK